MDYLAVLSPVLTIFIYVAIGFVLRRFKILGEEASTIEDVYEPYLLQTGLLKRTARGRMVTDLAYQHLNIQKMNLRISKRW